MMNKRSNSITGIQQSFGPLHTQQQMNFQIATLTYGMYQLLRLILSGTAYMNKDRTKLHLTGCMISGFGKPEDMRFRLPFTNSTKRAENWKRDPAAVV